MHILGQNKTSVPWNDHKHFFFFYRLGDIEDFPSLCVKRHQPWSDEVSSPRLHSAVQHLVQIHLDIHNANKVGFFSGLGWFSFDWLNAACKICMSAGLMMQIVDSYLIEVRPVGLSEVELLFLSEPAKLRFYHLLLSAERRQVEEVKPFAGVTCGGKKHREQFRGKEKNAVLTEKCTVFRLFLYARHSA